MVADTKKLYDLIGVGLGPYNMGLAALSENHLEGHFFEQTELMHWHPGMAIEGTNLQVSFLADLVTFADPTHKLSYLNYLKHKNRLYPFFFYHKFEIPRIEYEAYLQWAKDQLHNVTMGARVIGVDHQDEVYHVKVKHDGETEKIYKTKHLSIGTGAIPNAVVDLSDFEPSEVFHSAQYIYHRKKLFSEKEIVLIGSGQSASEIFLDLLKEQMNYDYHLSWYTRASGHVQLDQSKLGQEVFSPDYVDYFHQLSKEQRKDAMKDLIPLRNGVQEETLHEIYELLYHRTVIHPLKNVTIKVETELKSIKKSKHGYNVQLQHQQLDKSIHVEANRVILATGYKPNLPTFFEESIKPLISYEDDNQFKVTRDHQLLFKNGKASGIFMQTQLEQTHGTSATNLGLTVDRNVTILNQILNQEVYKRQTGGVFTTFSD